MVMNYFNQRFRRENQDFINFIISSVAYISLVIILISILNSKGTLPNRISVFDFVLILFATLRLTELFVYDKVMQFFRDIEEIEIKKTPTKYGLRRTVHDLLGCPWCTSIWTATIITFLYFLIPEIWILILILAVSGGATMIQLATNMIGWTSEKTEQEVEEKEEKEN